MALIKQSLGDEDVVFICLNCQLLRNNAVIFMYTHA